jgi:lysophospholipase L1-like esterase
MTRPILFATALLLAAALPATSAEPTFPLKDGDVWVMAGDSITAQHLHSNYFEAFCFARYPNLKFAFRNSGVGGHTIPSTMARFDYDIAIWKPTIVSVELGMNDSGNTATEKFIANMGEFDAMIRKAGARPIYLTASPVNDGNTMTTLSGRNVRLNEYANALKKFAAGKEAPFADQFHQVIDMWGANKPNEQLANAINAVRPLAQNDRLEGVEHLRAFLAAHAKSNKPLVSMMGDPVHPGAPGQLTMAAALLKDLGANPFVSEVVLDESGKVVSSKGCKVENAHKDNATISFTRLDDCLPFPIPDDARAVLPLFPTILDMSQYTLKVNGASGGFYLKINGAQVATITGEELTKGINLTAFDKGPIADQGKAVLAAVAAKEGLVGQVRNQARTAIAPEASAEVKAKFAALLKQVEGADAKIRDAAKPKPLKYELTHVTN